MTAGFSGCFLGLIISGLYGDLLAYDQCLEPESQLPRGAYLSKHCEDNLCVTGDHSYNALQDLLVLQQLKLTYILENMIKEVTPLLPVNPSSIRVSEVCKWVELGFDIDIHVDIETDRVEFMLLPPQPQPDLRITDINQNLPALPRPLQDVKDSVMTESFDTESVHYEEVMKQCLEISLFVEQDLVLYRCRRFNGDNDEVSAAIPYFYSYYMTATFMVWLVEPEGRLSPYKLFWIRGKLVTEPLSMFQHVKAHCANSGQALIEQHLGEAFGCHTQDTELLSAKLQQQEGALRVVLNRQKNYALLYYTGIKGMASYLMGVNLCFSNGLKLGYIESRRALYCVPDSKVCPETGIPRNSHQEL